MKRILATTAITAALLTSCYKTDLYDTNHPSQGELTIEITPPTQPDGTDYEDPMILIFDGEEYFINPGDSFDPGLLDPGTYTYYIYSAPSDGDTSTITYDEEAGTIIASVEVDSDGNVDPNPNVVYFGTETIVVTEDSVVSLGAESTIVGRDLHFLLYLEGDAAARLTSVEAKLNGVAQQWDCINDTHYGSSASVVPSLTISSTGVEASKSDDESAESYYLEGTVHLLGIVSDDTQLLTLELTYEDEHPSSHVFTSDVSDLMSGFNSSTSMTLTNTVETPTEAGFGGTIGSWSSSSYTVEAK